MIVVITIVQIICLCSIGCSNNGNDINKEELSVSMQSLYDSMCKVMAMNPYSWPEYEEYISSGSKDYEIISEPTKEAYAAYDKVVTYITVDIYEDISPETLEEIRNLINYIYLSVDYAIVLLSVFFSHVKGITVGTEDFAIHMGDFLESYWNLFIEEYNRVSERNGLQQIQLEI